MRMLAAIMGHDVLWLAKSGAAPVLALVLALLGLACRAALPASVFEKGSMPSVSVALVNPDDSAYSDMLYSLLKGLPEIDRLTWCGPEEAERLLESGEASVIVELPEDIVGALVDNRPAVVRIKAREAVAGASAYSVGASAANAMNAVQTAVYEYYAAARPLFGSDALFYLSYNKFCLELVSDAISREGLIEAERGGMGPYALQLAALMLFFACAGGAMAVAGLTAAQKAAGGLRRLRAAGAGLGHVLAGKSAGALAASMVFASLFVLFLGVMASGAANARFFASAFLTSALLAPMFLMISLFAESASQALLGGVAFLSLCLFEGGGFYPAYLFGERALGFNPARLNFMLADWASGGSFPAAQAVGCAAAALVCLGASVWAWRGAAR